MDKRKTEKQVSDEIKKLRDMKPNVRRFTAFGDDNWRRIEVQIAVLERNMDENDIGIYTDPDENSQAYDAIQWREGEIDESPSDGWKSLVRTL